ncbi:MAG: hypothetical protein U0797_31535 [Gemmataceae bacterium]
MICCSGPLGLLRSLVCLSLLGFAVTVLIGPAVAVAGTLLPFALIGGLVWGGYRGSRVLVRRLRTGRRVRLVIDEPPPAAPEPAPVAFSPPVEERPAPRAPGRMRSLLRAAMHVAVEVGCGAAVGAALGVLVDWQNGAGPEHVLLGAAIGAVVGFVVGGSRPGDAAEKVEEESGAASQAA